MNNTAKQRSARVRGASLPPSTISALNNLIRGTGVPGVAAMLRVSPSALVRAVSGLPVLAGTAALITMELRNQTGGQP